MATNEQIKVLVSSGDSPKTLAELKKHIKECKDALVGLEKGTEDYNKVALECAESMHKLTEITEQTRNASTDFGDRLSNITGTLGGMAGGVQAVISGLSLMGVEMGDDVKVMKLLTSSMALTNSISQIDSGVKAFGRLKNSILQGVQGMNKFKLALISTGLGALVVLLGSIIANWDEFTESIGLSSKQLEKLGQIWDGVMGVIKGGIQGIAKAFAKVLKGDFEGAWDELKKGFNVAETYSKGVQDGITKREKEAQEKRLAQQKELFEKQKELQKEIQAEQDAKHQLELKELENQRNKELITETEYYEKRKKLLNDYYNLVSKRGNTTDIQSQLQDIEGQILAVDKQINETAKKAEETERKTAKEKAQNTIKDINNDEEVRYAIERANLLLSVEENRQLKELELQREHMQNKIANLKETFEIQSATMEAGSTELLDLERQFNLNMANLTLESVQLEKQISDERVEIKKREVEKKKELEENYIKFTSSLLGEMGSIFGALADMNEENFETQKAFKVAEAITSVIQSGISAVTAIWSDPTIPTATAKGILTGVTVSSLLASGFAQIKQIQNTQPNTNSTNVSGVSGNINYGAVQNLTTQVQNTRQTTTATDIENMPEQRVYVVYSDLEMVGNSTRANIRNVTF